MPQVSLYVDDETMALLKKGAEQNNQSLSKYTSEAIRAYQPQGWPAGYWDLYGSLASLGGIIADVEDIDPALDDACPALF